MNKEKEPNLNNLEINTDDNSLPENEIEKTNSEDKDIKTKNEDEVLEDYLSNENEEDIIVKIKNELEDAIEQKMRALADAENTRRRTSKEIEQTRRYASLSFSRDMISVADSLEKAVESIPTKKEDLSDEITNVLIGVEMTLDQIKQAFNNNNINQINPIGEKFDYNFHQAMFEKENNELDAGTIIEVIQPGWTLHDRLIRPAMVGVSKLTKKEE